MRQWNRLSRELEVPRTGWVGSWAAWCSGWQLLTAGGWNWMIFKIPSKLSCSVFCDHLCKLNEHWVGVWLVGLKHGFVCARVADVCWISNVWLGQEQWGVLVVCTKSGIPVIIFKVFVFCLEITAGFLKWGAERCLGVTWVDDGFTESFGTLQVTGMVYPARLFGLISPSGSQRPGLLCIKWRREGVENSRRFSFIGVYLSAGWITVWSCPQKGSVDVSTVEGAWVHSVHLCPNKFLSCGYCPILHGKLVCLWEGTWLPRSVGCLIVISCDVKLLKKWAICHNSMDLFFKRWPDLMSFIANDVQNKYNQKYAGLYWQ